MKNNKILGAYGEVFAKNYLMNLGYKVIAENEKNACAEIDLIVKKDDLLVFVEVKTREGVLFGEPIEAVGRTKAKRYVRGAEIFLAKNHFTNCEIRFDVVCIKGEEIEHIPNAFDGNVL